MGDKAITKKCVGYRATNEFYATREFYTGTVTDNFYLVLSYDDFIYLNTRLYKPPIPS